MSDLTNELEKRIREMESKLADVDERVLDLTGEIQKAEEVKADLLVDKDLGILKSKKELQDAGLKVADLKRELDDKKILKTRLAEKIEVVKEDLRQEKIKKLSGECNRIEQAYLQGAGEVKELMQKLSVIRQRGTDLHQRWDSLQADIVKLGGEMRNAEKVFDLNRTGISASE